MNSTMVYVVEACGNDYYDSYEFHSVYTNKEDADRVAAHLKTVMEEPWSETSVPELKYDSVKVTPTKLHSSFDYNT
jgi:hypothetical protein